MAQEGSSYIVPIPLSPGVLTVACADGKADALAGTVKDDVEALHDDSPHDGACG